jgi:photosystem II stability/assembly factor-like uncharacterized protein
MSGSPTDSAPSEALSPRGRRALGVGAVAIIVMAVAAFGYLRSTTVVTTEQTTGLRSTDSPLVSLDRVLYDFVTPSLGWAVENPDGQFYVFTTKDRAKHWQQQLTGNSSNSGFSSAGPCCRPAITVHFFDKTHGYMVVDLAFGDEHAYLTSNGGDEWHAVRLPATQSVVVTFSDASHGWALAPVNPPQGELLRLYATSDAGSTWQLLPDPPGDARDVAFSGPTEGWMGSAGPGPPHTYSSADAGRSWQRHDLPPPLGQTWDTRGFPGTAVQLLPPIGVVATTDGGADAVDLFTSFDSGSTWTYVPPSPGAVGYQDALHWWAINGAALYESSDAGQTWSLITGSLPGWQFIGSPMVLDSQHAWAELRVAGEFGLAQSNDGGLHWARADVPHP